MRNENQDLSRRAESAVLQYSSFREILFIDNRDNRPYVVIIISNSLVSSQFDVNLFSIDTSPYQHKGGEQAMNAVVQNTKPTLAIIGSKGFHSDYGGVEKVVFSHAIRLSLYFQPIVYGNRRYCQETERSYEGVTTKYLDFPRLKLSGAALLSLWAFVDALHRGTTVFYVHACGPGFFCFLPRLLGKRVIWHFHGHDYHRARVALRSQVQNRSLTGILKQVLRYCFLRSGEWIAVRSSHEVLVLGSANMKSLQCLYPPCQTKMTLIYNYPELSNDDSPDVLKELGIKPGKFILSIGRLVAEKRIDMLIDAFNSLGDEADNDRLVIVGEGETGPELRKKATGNSSIIFTGAVPHQSVGTLYRNAAVFCLCSAIEGQSLALLEAISSGCPVLAADIPEIAEFGDETITLFRQGDPQDLRAKLTEILLHPVEARKKARIAMHTLSRTHSPDNVVSIIRDILMGDMGQHPNTPAGQL